MITCLMYDIFVLFYVFHYVYILYYSSLDHLKPYASHELS